MSHSVLILLLTFHFPGTMSLLTFATLVLVALNLGGIQYPWNSVPVLVCLIIGIFFLFVTVVIELRFAKEPMIPMHLFKKRTVLSVCVTGLFFGAAFAALIIELPLFLQVQRKLLVFMYRTITHYLCIQAARDDSATMSGVRIIVGQAAICIMSASAGYLMGVLNSYKPM